MMARDTRPEFRLSFDVREPLLEEARRVARELLEEAEDLMLPSVVEAYREEYPWLVTL